MLNKSLPVAARAVNKTSHKQRQLIANIFVHGLSALMFLPVVVVLMQAISGSTAGSEGLSALETLVHVSGESSERLLIASLLCTPLAIMFGWTSTNRYRKWLGLYAMIPLVIHVGAHLINRGTLGALTENLSMALGTVATVIMLALTVTSLNSIIKMMGKAWRKFHYTTYAVAILMELHVLFVDLPRLEPRGMFFGAIVAVLLLVRLPAVRRFFAARRRAQAIA